MGLRDVEKDDVILILDSKDEKQPIKGKFLLSMHTAYDTVKKELVDFEFSINHTEIQETDYTSGQGVAKMKLSISLTHESVIGETIQKYFSKSIINDPNIPQYEESRIDIKGEDLISFTHSCGNCTNELYKKLFVTVKPRSLTHFIIIVLYFNLHKSNYTLENYLQKFQLNSWYEEYSKKYL